MTTQDLAELRALVENLTPAESRLALAMLEEAGPSGQCLEGRGGGMVIDLEDDLGIDEYERARQHVREFGYFDDGSGAPLCACDDCNDLRREWGHNDFYTPCEQGMIVYRLLWRKLVRIQVKRQMCSDLEARAVLA